MALDFFTTVLFQNAGSGAGHKSCAGERRQSRRGPRAETPGTDKGDAVKNPHRDYGGKVREMLKVFYLSQHSSSALDLSTASVAPAVKKYI